MNYEYGLIFEDNELDHKVIEILNKINDNVSSEDTFVDVFHFEETFINIFVEFNKYNCEDENSIMNDISEVVTEMGYPIEWDNHPNVNEDAYCQYSYDAVITLK